jgi:hypothetical protein
MDAVLVVDDPFLTARPNKRLEPTRLALPVYCYAYGRAAQAQR